MKGKLIIGKRYILRRDVPIYSCGFPSNLKHQKYAVGTLLEKYRYKHKVYTFDFGENAGGHNGHDPFHGTICKSHRIKKLHTLNDASFYKGCWNVHISQVVKEFNLEADYKYLLEYI